MNTEYEKLCLAAALKNRDALAECMEKLEPKDFVHPTYREWFAAMVQCYLHGNPVEYGSISQLCDIKLNDYIDLTMLPALPTNISGYINYVRDGRLRADVTAHAEALLRDVGKMTIEDIRSSLLNTYLSVSGGVNTYEADPDVLYKSGSYIPGETGHIITTGFDAIDGPLPGILDDQLVILAARPSLGKTALALQIARHMATIKPVAFYSLEMSRERLRDRMVSQLTQIDSMDIITRSLSSSDVENIDGALEVLRTRYRNLILVDNFKPTIDDILTDIYAKANKHDLGAVFIDYLQLVRNDKNKGSRNEQVSEISCALKNAAKSLHVPIIALSQLSRAGAMRTDDTPVLSDLRDSGAIEQDADVVIFIHAEKNTEFGVPVHYIIIAKNRDMISNVKQETMFTGNTFTFR